MGSLIAIDVGNEQSGMVVLNGLKIAFAGNIQNGQILKLIYDRYREDKTVIVLIEDMKPYSVALTQHTIDTCKFIGKLSYFCDMRRIPYRLITRHQVKKWVYDRFPEIVLGLVLAKIEKRDKKNNDGKLRSPSYVYVDDGIIVSVMKDYWKLEKGRGKRNIHGITAHAWQALAVGTYFTFANSTSAGALLQKK